MNLITSHQLYLLLASLRQQANAHPEQFSIAAKAAIAENMRNLIKPARSYEEQRDALIKEHGDEVEEPEVVAKEGEPAPPAKPPRYQVTQDSEKFSEFQAFVEALGDRPSGVRLRFIYETQLEGAPLTVDQIDQLSVLGVLKSAER